MSDTVWNCKQRLQILGTELVILEIWKRSVSETQKISSGRTHYVYMIIFFSHPCENTLVSTFPHLQNVLMKLQTLNDFPLWHIKISNVNKLGYQKFVQKLPRKNKLWSVSLQLGRNPKSVRKTQGENTPPITIPNHTTELRIHPDTPEDCQNGDIG